MNPPHPERAAASERPALAVPLSALPSLCCDPDKEQLGAALPDLPPQRSAAFFDLCEIPPQCWCPVQGPWPDAESNPHCCEKGVCIFLCGSRLPQSIPRDVPFCTESAARPGSLRRMSTSPQRDFLSSQTQAVLPAGMRIWASL